MVNIMLLLKNRCRATLAIIALLVGCDTESSSKSVGLEAYAVRAWQNATIDEDGVRISAERSVVDEAVTLELGGRETHPFHVQDITSGVRDREVLLVVMSVSLGKEQAMQVVRDLHVISGVRPPKEMPKRQGILVIARDPRYAAIEFHPEAGSDAVALRFEMVFQIDDEKSHTSR